jgi:hypothetical protein
MTNDYPDNEIRPFRIDIPQEDLEVPDLGLPQCL